MEIKRLTCILLFAFSFFVLSAQEQRSIDIGIARHYRIFTTNSGFDPGIAGTSLRVSAGIPLQGVSISPGMEMGASAISNYLAGTIGAYRNFSLSESNFSIQTGVKTTQGAMLFHQKPIYFFGFSEETSLNYHTKKNRILAFFLEGRYLYSPGYSDYSNNSGFLEFHLGIRYQICTL